MQMRNVQTFSYVRIDSILMSVTLLRQELCSLIHILVFHCPFTSKGVRSTSSLTEHMGPEFFLHHCLYQQSWVNSLRKEVWLTSSGRTDILDSERPRPDLVFSPPIHLSAGLCFRSYLEGQPSR